ncbi:MAG: NAD(P)/FAD-dependent oxidoreductase [Thermomicrobiales bacterium]
MKSTTAIRPSRSASTYDLVVLGGGAAGSVAASSAVSRGARVAMIERWKIGGTCLNAGCDPTKTLVRSAEIQHLIRNSRDYGIVTGESHVDWPAVMRRVQDVIDTIRGGDGDANVRASGVELYKGSGRFRSAHEIEVNENVLVSDKVIVATGAATFIPTIAGLHETGFITNLEAVELKQLPSSMAIVGGGPIAIEFAQIFARFGVQVTVIGSRDRILPREEPELSDALQEILRNEGVRIETGVRITAARREGNAKILSGDQAEAPFSVSADEILIAAGRRPVVHGLGLDAAGVDYHTGGVQVDEFMRTTAPNIWAAGDVTGDLPFTHVADDQARIAEANALGNGRQEAYDGYAIPWATFTDPELARVGLTQREAIEAGFDIATATVRMRSMPRAITGKQTSGQVKLIADRATGLILGGHILAAHGAELLSEVVLAMRSRLPVSAIARSIHAYPTLSESVFWAAVDLDRQLSQISPVTATEWRPETGVQAA